MAWLVVANSLRASAAYIDQCRNGDGYHSVPVLPRPPELLDCLRQTWRPQPALAVFHPQPTEIFEAFAWSRTSSESGKDSHRVQDCWQIVAKLGKSHLNPLAEYPSLGDPRDRTTNLFQLNYLPAGGVGIVTVNGRPDTAFGSRALGVQFITELRLRCPDASAAIVQLPFFAGPPGSDFARKGGQNRF